MTDRPLPPEPPKRRMTVRFGTLSVERRVPLVLQEQPGLQSRSVPRQLVEPSGAPVVVTVRRRRA